MFASFIPECKFNAIPNPKLIVDGAKVILYDILTHADGSCNFTVFESLGNKLDDSSLSLGEVATSVAFWPTHGGLQALSPDSDAASGDNGFPLPAKWLGSTPCFEQKRDERQKEEKLSVPRLRVGIRRR
jgi:hypothetical protein